jgi:hypothetical protein
MFMMRGTGIFLLSLFLCGAFFGQRGPLKTAPGGQNTTREIQQLSASNHSTFAEPFIFVARDVQTYEMLQKLVQTLPKQDAKFFESNAVIGVFLGTRPTGGYNIDITAETDGTIRISERRPPKGAMLKTVLSSPHKVVAVPTGENKGLTLALDERWQQALRSYPVTDGEMTVSGGFAGREETFKLQGKVDMLRADDLVTFFFDIQGSEKHRLVDFASGKVDKKKFVLNGMDAFGLARAVNSPFRVTGEFSDEGRQVKLQLETVPNPHVSDNFGGVGTLQATVAK